MKSRELDKMDDPFTYIKQDDDVGEVEGPKWVKSNGESAPEWIEDDDDFRVVLRRPNGVNTGLSGSGGRVPETTQQTTQETTQQTTQRTTQQTTQRTTQQTTQRMLLKLMPIGNMRNIVSLVMKNPEINIAGMAHVLGLSQNGIKYHIKQIRKKIAFKHVGPWNAGHWEIGLKETL